MAIAATTDKGNATREMILDHAYKIASKHGLEGLSIGDLAQSVGMSKSGVFAHFGSREELQLAVLDLAGQRFSASVLVPALNQPRGLKRLRAVVNSWFAWVRDNRDGCVIMGAASEYDSRPGPLRDRVVALMSRWNDGIERAVAHAIEAGELDAATDPRQLAFELSGIAFAMHHEMRLFDQRRTCLYAERAVERLIAANSR